jgi:predicted RNA-binding protein with EMAP domain
MKKIERINIYKAAENNKAVVDDIMVMVKKADLDKLELDIEVLNCGIRERDEIIKNLKKRGGKK